MATESEELSEEHKHRLARGQQHELRVRYFWGSCLFGTAIVIGSALLYEIPAYQENKSEILCIIAASVPAIVTFEYLRWKAKNKIKEYDRNIVDITGNPDDAIYTDAYLKSRAVQHTGPKTDTSSLSNPAPA